MSIIEKAAGKLAKMGKAGNTPSEEPSDEPALDDNPGIIEKAANKRLNHVVARMDPSFEEILPEGSPHPHPTTADRMEKGGIGASPSPSIQNRTQKQGIINLEKLRLAGMITPDGDRSQIAEAFRLIKRPLLANSFHNGTDKSNNHNLIMVTSALAEEGKTFCATNLAMSIAMEMDHTVLLVDADVARPSVLEYLGLEPSPGLLDVLLEDKLDLADVLIRTNVEKLAILPAGSKHKRSTELLGSHAMSDLLKEIALRYPDRIVIFDAPPLLLTSEAQALASQMGQIVMVVEAETTPQKAVMEALRQIESCDTVNFIYNKARPFPGGDFYGYYYN